MAETPDIRMDQLLRERSCQSEEKNMGERPHSRKVKIAEGIAEVKKGEKLEGEARASQRKAEDGKKTQKKGSED